MKHEYKTDSTMMIWKTISSIVSKIFVWGVILSIVYLLRSFFPLIFLTFVFAYIQSNATDRLEPYIKIRPLRVVLVGLFFLAVIIAIGTYIVPAVIDQAKVFSSSFTENVKNIDTQLVKMQDRFPELSNFIPQLNDLSMARDDNGNFVQWRSEKSPTNNILQELLGYGHAKPEGDHIRSTLDTLQNVGRYTFGITSNFLLALLFSFLIVLDLRNLEKGVKSLANTRVGFIYKQVAPSVQSFSRVLGHALEAQFYIAVMNTFFTGIGLWLLGMTSKMSFLLMIVFFCSFIPIAGVFISSVPICLMALQDSGIGLMLVAILMITIVHILEAYVLNPKIFGHHLRLNPVIVLIILTISGELFGFWGLVLGLPVSTYVFKYAIK